MVLCTCSYPLPGEASLITRHQSLINEYSSMLFRIISLLRTTFTQLIEYREVDLVPAWSFHPYVLILLVLRNIFKNTENTKHNKHRTPFKTGPLQKQSFQTDTLGRFFSLSIIMINSFVRS